MINDEWNKSSFCQKIACLEVRWRKSSECSMGTCVEARSVKSSKCTYGDCVEATFCEGHVELRDSKSPDLVMSITHDDWQAFIAGVKLNEFDLPTADI
jgi:putative sterol carrier protein